jgi:hypothetical protein
MKRNLLEVEPDRIRRGRSKATLKLIKGSVPPSVTPAVRSAFGAHGALQAWQAKAPFVSAVF